MPDFVDQAILLVSHKCWFDYTENLKKCPNTEPEAFFDSWVLGFMTNIEDSFKETVWKNFMKKLTAAQKLRRE